MKGSVYLDTNILITLFEGHHGQHVTLWEFMNAAIQARNVAFHTSALTFSELLVRPYRSRDEPLAHLYMQLAKSGDWLAVDDVLPIVIETSAAIRAATRLRLPDALHLATAMSVGCKHFLTLDTGITSLPQLQHPISGKPTGQPIEVIHPDAASLLELAKALS